MIATELPLAWCAYLVWLSAGLGDFISHWRTDLPRTSGVAESTTHLVQLGVLGTAVLLVLAFETGKSIALLLFVLVIAHAIVGYVDTRIAFGRRRTILPIEQHLHSVLDMAPIVFFAWLMISSRASITNGEWNIALRSPALPVAVWLCVLLPAVVLCIVPALVEFRAAWKAMRVDLPATQD